jgi:hypothetical protein
MSPQLCTYRIGLRADVAGARWQVAGRSRPRITAFRSQAYSAYSSVCSSVPKVSGPQSARDGTSVGMGFKTTVGGGGGCGDGSGEGTRLQ